MSQENVELVRRYVEVVQRAYDAYFQRPYSVADSLRSGEVEPEIADVVRYLHPNVEWKSAMIGVTSRGYEGTARGLDRLLEPPRNTASTSRRSLISGPTRSSRCWSCR